MAEQFDGDEFVRRVTSREPLVYEAAEVTPSTDDPLSRGVERSAQGFLVWIIGSALLFGFILFVARYAG